MGTKKLQEKTQDKDGFYEKKAMLAAKMATYGEQIKKLNEQRADLKAQLKAKSEQKKECTTNLKNAERSITFKSEEELEKKIAEIEFQMYTGTLTLQEEKRKVQEIQSLKKQKPKINAANEKLESLKAKHNEMKESFCFQDMQEQLEAVTEKVNTVWEARVHVRDEYIKLTEERKKETESSDL